jgi:hypothetical protein
VSQQHFITTIAKIVICGRCRQPILTGHAEGIPARVDATPVNRFGEIEAIREGRSTYQLRGGRLVYRQSEQILHDNGEVQPILIAHRCGTDISTRYRSNSASTSQPASQPISDTPLF